MSERFFLDKSDPASWRALNGLALKVKAATDDSGIPRSVVELLNMRVSQINGCAFCLDMHGRLALEAGVSSQQLAVLPVWRETDLFTELERAALAIGEAAALLTTSESRQVELQEARTALTDEQFSALQWAGIAINAFNRVSIMSQHPVRARK
ncbi:carboxymuconolactone decarboxylase family protein [Arthrobacter sp. Sr24]